MTGARQWVRSVAQLLLFSDVRRAAELAPVLWPALHEAAAFWGQSPEAPVFSQYLSGRLPLEHPAIAALTARMLPEVRTEDWDRLPGRYSRTVDPERLATVGRELVDGHSDVLIVITDQELTPPKGWRYLIWCDAKSDETTLVSTAAMDPRYWSIPDSPERLAILKHRLRSALLGIVGEWLGLESCHNGRCVMYEDIDSVECLDSMVLLGGEHDSHRLLMKGYDPRPSDPAQAQPIIDHPKPPEVGAQ